MQCTLDFAASMSVFSPIPFDDAADYGLSVCEVAALWILNDYALQKEALVEKVCRVVELYAPQDRGGPIGSRADKVDAATAADSIDALVLKHLVVSIDEYVLSGIRSLLAARKLKGEPIAGLPRIGSLDLSLAGYAFVSAWLSRLAVGDASVVSSEHNNGVFYLYAAEAEHLASKGVVESFADGHGRAILRGEPEAIGCWAERWHCVHRGGYRMRVQTQ